MQGIKTDTAQLIKTHGSEFTKLYLSGISINKCAPLLGITAYEARLIKNTLNLPVDKWQKINLPLKFSDETVSLLYGTLMGDAYLRNSGKYHSLGISHSPKQIAYLQHKRNLLSEIKPYEIKKSKDKWGTLSFITAPHPHLSEIFYTFYGLGTKQISYDILQKLTPKAIALWFMDDGSIIPNKHGFTIATCSFDLRSINNIIFFFKETFGITVKVYLDKGKYPKIYFYGIEAIKFKNLIEPFVTPDLEYKLKLKTNFNKKWTQEEINFLINNLSKPRKELSINLNVSEDAIYNKIRSLKKSGVIL